MKKKNKHHINTLLACTCLLFMVLTLPVQVTAKSLKVISGFPQTHLFTEGCLGIFTENLKEISGGKLVLQSLRSRCCSNQ